MPDILIKKLSTELHSRLKDEAKKHHRSMNKEIIAMLEDVLMNGESRPELPKPLYIAEPIDDDFINKAKRSGRE